MNKFPRCVYLPLEVANAMSADAPPDLGDILYVRAVAPDNNALSKLDILLRMVVSGEHQGKVREAVNVALTTVRQEALSGDVIDALKLLAHPKFTTDEAGRIHYYVTKSDVELARKVLSQTEAATNSGAKDSEGEGGDEK